jgi:hypothetical protein
VEDESRRDLEAVVGLRAVATNGSVAAAADALVFTLSAVSAESLPCIAAARRIRRRSRRCWTRCGGLR